MQSPGAEGLSVKLRRMMLRRTGCTAELSSRFRCLQGDFRGSELPRDRRHMDKGHDGQASRSPAPVRRLFAQRLHASPSQSGRHDARQCQQGRNGIRRTAHGVTHGRKHQRSRLPRQTRRVPRIAHSTSVTIAIRPSQRGGTTELLIFLNREATIFARRGREKFGTAARRTSRPIKMSVKGRNAAQFAQDRIGKCFLITRRRAIFRLARAVVLIGHLDFIQSA
jgi:hypothetical protein